MECVRHRDGLGDDNYILLNTTAVRNGSTDWFQVSTQQLLHHISEVQALSGFHIVLRLMLRDTQGNLEYILVMVHNDGTLYLYFGSQICLVNDKAFTGHA